MLKRVNHPGGKPKFSISLSFPWATLLRKYLLTVLIKYSHALWYFILMIKYKKWWGIWVDSLNVEISIWQNNFIAINKYRLDVKLNSWNYDMFLEFLNQICIFILWLPWTVYCGCQLSFKPHAKVSLWCLSWQQAC